MLHDISHADPRWGVDPDGINVIVALGCQSPDIARGIEGDDMGAGDQGMMFGFAIDETRELMPLPIALAHALMRRHKAMRETAEGAFLGPDAKAQVTIRYENGRPAEIDTVVLSTQHERGFPQDRLRRWVEETIIAPVLPISLPGPRRVLVNPTGIFEIGGPAADAGLTGRKIIVDTYGGYARHGGGAFSGKDPTKVDRSAAYAARHLAKAIVAGGWAKACEVRVAYAIGVAEPVAIDLETFGTGRLPDAEILLAAAPDAQAAFRSAAIIRRLERRQPIYRQTAAFGHFGREDFPWEKTVSQQNWG